MPDTTTPASKLTNEKLPLCGCDGNHWCDICVADNYPEEITSLQAEVERLKHDVSDMADRCRACEHSNLGLNKRNYELTTDLAARNAIIEKLPMTADKVRMWLGMTVWLVQGDATSDDEDYGRVPDWELAKNGILEVTVRGVHADPIRGAHFVESGASYSCSCRLDQCYSTPEAAKEAADA